MSVIKWDSLINTKILINYFKELCKNYLSPYRDSSKWMNRRILDSNNRMIFFLSQIVQLIDEDKVDAEVFKSEIKKIKDGNILKAEVLWYLEFFRIMTLMEFIQFHENNNNEDILKNLSQQIFTNLLDFSLNSSKIRKEILCCYLKTILQCSNHKLKSYFFKIQLELIVTNLKFLYSAEENCCYEKFLSISDIAKLFDEAAIPNDLVQAFFEELLKPLLLSSSQSIKSILKKQELMKNQVKNVKIYQLYQIIANYCDINFFFNQLEIILFDSRQSIEWQNLLCLITFYGTYYKNGWSNLKTLVSSILKVAFQNCDCKLLLSAFLIARQGCFEKSKNFFTSYLQWFSVTFSPESKKPLNSKKSCIFFFNFLTDLIPYDSTFYLKVHINKIPWVPSECYSILHDYIDLVKVQLDNLNVSSDLGICENTTSKSAASFDVEKVLKHFQSNNEILSSVYQASLFQKEYYEKKFLVQLLSKFEGKTSARHKVIMKLHSAGKIPKSLFTSYKKLEKVGK